MLCHRATTITILATAIGAFVFAIIAFLSSADTTTTQSLSPDEQLRIYLTEVSPTLRLGIDRKFKLLVVTLDPHDKREVSKVTLFVSPDEGNPVGSERFIWSKDSTYVLLVGRHFFVAADLDVGRGEQAYFLYHVPSQRSWCNSKQVKCQLLTERELRGIEFTQPVSLEQAQKVQQE